MKCKFKRDLATGRKAEEVVASLYQQCGLTTSFCDNSDYDILVKELEITLEVKFDKMASKTGNMAIEVRNTSLNKPSGLYVTKADIWVCVLEDGSVHIIKVDKLKQILSTTKPKKVIKRAGDNNAHIVLYPLTTLLPCFTRIDHLGITDLINVTLSAIGEDICVNPK